MLNIALIRLVARIGLLSAISSFQAFAADPIKIGLIAESSGAGAVTGGSQINGVKLALEEINKSGGILGRPLELEMEDNQSTNPGSVLAFSKIIDRGDIVAVVSSTRSTQILAMMPAILKAGIPTMVGGTEYTLTHANNPWIFRVRPHDGYSAKVLANFGVNTLKRKKWAIVHSAEAFGIGGKNRLLEELKALGITPIVVQGINANGQDFSLVIPTIKQSNADIVAAYIAGAENIATFATQLRQSDANIALIGSPSIAAGPAIKQAGNALYGSYSIVDFVAESSVVGQAYAKRYKEKFGLEPDYFSGWTYDAVNLIALAIKSANSVKPDAIRKAILSIQGYQGVEGTYFYDQNGDGLHGYNVVKNDHGKIIFIKHVSFQPP